MTNVRTNKQTTDRCDTHKHTQTCQSSNDICGQLPALYGQLSLYTTVLIKPGINIQHNIHVKYLDSVTWSG